MADAPTDPFAEDRLKRHIKKALKKLDSESATFGDVKRSLCKSMSVDIAAVNEHKELIKTLVTKVSEELLEETQEGKEKSPKQDASAEKQVDPHDESISLLRQMWKAAGMGPAALKDVKEMDKKEQVETLREKLKEAGVKFKGDVPTKSEIEKVKKEKERAKELEGLDTSNIIQSGKRKITSAPEPLSLSAPPRSKLKVAKVPIVQEEEAEFE